MFNSKARYYNNLFSIILKFFVILFSLPLSIILFLNIFEIINIIPDKLYIDKANPWMRLLTNILFFGIIGGSFGFLVAIASLIMKKKTLTIYTKECYEIISNTKLPEKLPKVLYIYTTHNDFIEARVLQNMKQTYKNFEVWVSDGSSKQEWRDKVSNFCKEHKINLFQLELPGSKNKADNLNNFLRNYKGEYDYILIGDSDEVFHPNFVESAVKMFYYPNIKNLGYVSPININYRCKGIYPNTLRILETNNYYWEVLPRSLNNHYLAPLPGQSCLISKEVFEKVAINSQFDEGNLEDWYLETNMVENGYHGVMIPNTPCFFEPDVNIVAHFNRIMRVYDWIIRWWKIGNKKILFNYNEKYSSWYKLFISNLFSPIIIFLSLSTFSVFTWLVATNWDYSFKNNILFWISIGLSLFSSFVFLILNSILIGYRKFNFWDYLFYPIIFLMWSFVANIKLFQHWFKSLFLSKYSSFGGSGNSRFIKTNSKTLRWWISWIIFTAILVTFNTCVVLLTNWTNLRWLLIIVNVFVGSIWLGINSYLILWYINFIPYNNQFSRNDEIDCGEILKR